MQKIIGYHGTKKRYADLIIKDGFKITEKKPGDNHWLGHGIYFYSDYELAEWWGKKKVEKQNKKYQNNDSPIVVKAVIEGNNVWDLDQPLRLQEFIKCQKELEGRLVKDGVVLDFSKGDSSAKLRCFWMDCVKEEKDIHVLIYTFSKNNPSYIDREYCPDTNEEFSLKNLGLEYHEKQICVSDNRFIVDKKIVKSGVEEFDEVIV